MASVNVLYVHERNMCVIIKMSLEIRNDDFQIVKYGMASIRRLLRYYVCKYFHTFVQVMTYFAANVVL